MKFFLSYASEDLIVAEEVHLALLGAGHDVFFDKPAISAGENYIALIAQGIADSDGLIFLISPDSIATGSYALTELREAREKWPHPKKRVLPISIRPLKYELIPAYLRAVAILEPEGNVAAEVVAVIGKWHFPVERTDLAPAMLRRLIPVLAIMLTAIGLGTMFSLSYPSVAVDLSIAFLIVLVSATIVFAFRAIWRKFMRSRS